MRASPSLTSSNILSKVYNCVRAPSKSPKCSICANQQIERQLQITQGLHYICIPDRHVEVYLCNFCKKLDQHKCQHCFANTQCCIYKQQSEYQEYHSTLKKQIIKTVNSVSQTFKTYQDRSMKDLTFPLTSYISPSSINKELMVYMADVQYKLKKQIEEQIQKNQKELFGVYKEFQNDLVCKLYPYSPEGLQRYKTDLGPDATKNMSLQDCVKFLEQIQKYKQDLELMGHQICDKYIHKINFEYPKTLYYRLNQAFRQFLIPKVTFKEALIQTVNINAKNPGSSNSIDSEKSLGQKKQGNFVVFLQDKVAGLQKIIQKNFQTIKRQEERIKDLEFVVNVEQNKNQELEMRIIELETKIGMSRKEKDLSIGEYQFSLTNSKDLYGRQTRQLDGVKPCLKISKSDPNLLRHFQVNSQVNSQVKQTQQIQKAKVYCKMVKSQQEQRTDAIRRPRKISEGKKSFKEKSQQSNNSWLEQLVNEIKQ